MKLRPPLRFASQTTSPPIDGGRPAAWFGAIPLPHGVGERWLAEGETEWGLVLASHMRLPCILLLEGEGYPRVSSSPRPPKRLAIDGRWEDGRAIEARTNS